jgi:hypothetical protein
MFTKAGRTAAAAAALTIAAVGTLCTRGAHGAELLVNPFHDPFAQLTHGLASCPVPGPPTYTHAEMAEVEHHRVERGNSCYLAGKCRYASSFMYDRGIAAGLFPALARDPSLRDSSIWAWVEGRTVQLLGCVRDRAQLAHARHLAEHWPDVQTVLPGLMLGTDGTPPYTVETTAARPK